MKIQSYQFLTLMLLMIPLVVFAQKQKHIQSKQLEETNLLIIIGGTFNMGQGAEKDITRRVTVSTFYIDAAEITNKEYREFVNWVQDHQGAIVSKEMLPDTSLWVHYIDMDLGSKLAKDYFRLPAFDYYPVVGVSWTNAQAFTEWRSDRRNEQSAVKSGVWTPDLQKKYTFSTSQFLAGYYHKQEGKKFPKNVDLSLPNYRLLTEAEWEFAARILLDKETAKSVSKQDNKNINKYRKLVLRHAKKHPVPDYYKTKKYALPKSIFEKDINKYGILNLNDNIFEWVQDTYRPIVKETIVTNPNAPAPNVERGTNIDIVPMNKMNAINIPWEEEVANGKAIEKSRAVDANTLMVLKGALVTNSKDKKSPGNRYSAKASGQYKRLIGFRCGMTRTWKP